MSGGNKQYIGERYERDVQFREEIKKLLRVESCLESVPFIIYKVWEQKVLEMGYAQKQRTK